jgi:hypothetical protein
MYKVQYQDDKKFANKLWQYVSRYKQSPDSPQIGMHQISWRWNLWFLKKQIKLL